MKQMKRTSILILLGCLSLSLSSTRGIFCAAEEDAKSKGWTVENPDKSVLELIRKAIPLNWIVKLKATFDNKTKSHGPELELEKTKVDLTENVRSDTFLPAKSCAATDDGKYIPREETQNLQRDLIEWMRSNGAFVGHRQEVRLEDPQDPWSRFGVFATERIEKGELLLSVPLELMIGGNSSYDPQNDFSCDALNDLRLQIELGDESHVAPYVRYLKSIPEGVLPEAWSDAGRKLLEELLGNKLPPQPYEKKLHKQFVDLCGGGDDPFEKWMVYLSAFVEIEEEIMVPYWDFFNHRNGHWHNANDDLQATLGRDKFELAWADSTTTYDETFKVSATRTIQPGEQIYISINRCIECTDWERTEGIAHGTADMLSESGFVEDLPQRWTFKIGEELKDIHIKEKRDGSGDLEVAWGLGKHPPKNDVKDLVENVKHLEKFEKTHRRNATNDIPGNEWNIIWQYHDALKIANKAIIKHMNSDAYNEDAIHLDEDAIFNDRTQGCMLHKSYLDLAPFHIDKYEDAEESMFQTLSNIEDPEADNKCFSLDNHIQICSDHRAHYHEPFVHFTTSFLKELKRVAFVGGGDSMILHEVLKYPSVELVIGLELDQKCVRKNFKHFNTQPHFEDERVQWWFGDATKSLTMLPKEYFGSFDLVLVDLSETATSLNVTQHLNMFEALALLVKPDGIFVKNEIYTKELNEIFDHTITLYEDHVPMVCKQDFSMASNKIDFLKPNFEIMKKYKPETFVYKPLEDIDTHYSIFRDYAKNDARAQGKCEELDEKMYDSDEQRRAGIVLIVEAENASGASMKAETLETTLTAVLINEGLSPYSAVAQSLEGGGAVAIISMKQGYVVAHTWPEHSYVGLEIHLWAHFAKMETIKSSLLDAVGSTKGPWSTYRIVAGGMLGTENWKDEQSTIGPRPIQSRDCVANMNSGPDDTTIGTVMEETLSIIESSDNTTALVLCGDISKGSCKTLQAFEKTGMKTLVSVWTCQPGEHGEIANTSALEMKDGIATMTLCGPVISIEWLKDIVKAYGKVGFIAVDPEASRVVIRSLSSFLHAGGTDKNIAINVADNVVIVVPIVDSDGSRMTLVDASRRRREIYEHVDIHEITVGPIETGMKVWFTATRRPAFLSLVADIARKIEQQTGIMTAVTGNKIDIVMDWKNVPHDPYVGTMEDYETVPGLIQFSNQLPLGIQSIYQFQYTGASPLTVTQLEHALARVLSEMALAVSASAISSESGDGALIFSALKEGHGIVLWDGGSFVDTNLFTHDQTILHKDVFAEKFMKYVGDLKYVLRDEMPRGTGHVVNLMKDIGTRTPGCYDLYRYFCSMFAEKGDCVTDKSWMEVSCSKSCGFC